MKYFSHKIKTPDGVFDSKQEYDTFLYLKHQEDIGVIIKLERQKSFEIIPRLTKTVKVELKTKTKFVERVEEKAAHYTPDFCYWKDGKYVIHEVKSAGTSLARDYPLRRKLIKQVISRHNQEVGFEEWVFVETGVKKKQKKS
ncbi:phage related protein [gut metagenome]|uniref:Phage related protein n=1 Tax=gut metagenome TaxID=749906 RepID=J9FQM9_9ZZZZ